MNLTEPTMLELSGNPDPASSVRASSLNMSIRDRLKPGQALLIRDAHIDSDEPLVLPQDADTVTIKNCRFTLRQGVETAVQGEDMGREGVFLEECSGPHLFLISNKVFWPDAGCVPEGR